LFSAGLEMPRAAAKKKLKLDVKLEADSFRRNCIGRRLAGTTVVGPKRTGEGCDA
jgi:hypothetical protein